MFTAINISNKSLDKKMCNCPVCNNQGVSVKKITVEHLVNDESRDAVKDDLYRICMNEDCDVVYYSENSESKFMKNQVKVPIWFKRDANPKYACYCSKVTEEQVIDAVINKDARTVKEVNAVTGAMKDSNCKEKNPLGTCCHGVIQGAINKALEKLNK